MVPESYEDFREKWVHEDNLFNNRLTWLLLSQTLLFAAYGVCLTVPKDALFLGKVERLVLVLPILGILLAITVSASVAAAYFAQRALEKKIGGALNVPGGHNWVGYSPMLVYPIFFLLAWALVLVP